MTPDTHDAAGGAADRVQRTAARPGAKLAARIRRCRTSATARSGARLVVALLLVAVLAGLALTVLDSNAFAVVVESDDFRSPIERGEIEKAQEASWRQTRSGGRSAVCSMCWRSWCCWAVSPKV